MGPDSPHTMTVTIPYDRSKRNSKNETIIPFDPDIVGRNPIALLTPWWDGSNKNVSFVPTVSGIIDIAGGKALTVADSNKGDNYFLNALLVYPEIDDIHGLRAIANSNLKRTGGKLKVPGLPGGYGKTVEMLTPFWNGHHGRVGSIETVDQIHKGASSPDSLWTTVSGNAAAASDYFVNHISCVRDAIQHAAMSGYFEKAKGGTLRISFAKPWDNPPVVFVTPWLFEQGKHASYIDTVTKVTPEYFEVTSGSQGGNTFVNWLAVTSNPNYHKHHVNEGIEHFLEHFPAFTNEVEQNRAALEAEIIDGTSAPAERLRLRSDATLVDPYTTRFTGSTLILDIATLVLDSVGLVLTCIGAKTAYTAAKNAKAADAIAEVLAGNPSEVTALTQDVKLLVAEMKAAKDLAQKAKIQGRIILALLGTTFSGGLIKTILTKIYYSMTRWQFIVVAVKLAAQLAALVAGAIASAGALAAMEFIAWLGRIAAMIMGTASIGIDIYNLVNDIATGNEAAPT